MQSIWRFDPTSLKLFIAACEQGSIARAAERENMVPSAVSKRIAELEEAVGTPLFYRHKKGIEATPAGQCLLEHARRVVDDLLLMSAEMSGFADGQRGHIRVGANRSSIIQFLPRDLRAFRDARPDIAIELQEQTSEEAVESVLGNQSDLAIGTDLSGAALRGLDVHDYHSDELVLVVPQGHPLAGKTAAAFSDSLSFSHIALHKDSPLYRMLDQAARHAKKTIKYEVHVKSFDAVCRMVQAGLGMAVIPRQAISHAEGPDLIIVALTDSWATRRFHIVSRPAPYLSTVCKSFLEFLSAQVPGPRG
ncbi:HTH-type transcriptional regulator YofA [Pseudomonas fluorescens]|uniref:HTH-type transcriptional regulator YofA n=1 Tax=Pseudomonas fluorescens TaxID=294 RepID=A0A5E7T3J6_PSEFL|nr:LysR family transcriptional regulator [Pseudomonas fluorescens]VVP93621.1 HTH-type transcriptional regulator YofA [Pseudomonas fluorescens]